MDTGAANAGPTAANDDEELEFIDDEHGGQVNDSTVAEVTAGMPDFLEGDWAQQVQDKIREKVAKETGKPSQA